MKKLKLKRLLQDKKSLDCGPVVVQSILDFFGIKKSLAELSKELRYTEVGTSLYDNGLALVQNGLTVTAITSNPLLFASDDRLRLQSRSALLKFLDGLALKSKGPKQKHRKLGIKLFIKFIAAGGNVRLEIPRYEHITKAIDAGKPIMALLYARAFGKNEGGYHFVAVSGYDRRYIYVMNPYPPSKKTKIPIADFMYALHASSCADIDNGSLLVVSKQKISRFMLGIGV